MRVAEQAGSVLPQVARGLRGITVAATQIAEVDGARGRLTLRGYDVRELIGRVTFEEVAYLLWHGRLPSRKEYATLRDDMSRARELPDPTIAALRELAPHVSGMHMLRMAAAMLSLDDPDVDSLEIKASLQRAARLQAQLPALIAHTWRLKNGQELVPPKAEHGLAEGFLYMLEGEEPSQARIDGFNAYLSVVAEHGLNASTFTGRVVISTNSDMVSALTAAIGALKGPAHGGVPGPVLHMLEEIGVPEQAEPWIRAELAAGRRIMGFGHRIYKVRDPRAAVLTEAVERMAAATGERTLLELTQAVEQTTVKVLAEVKPDRDLYANVELYAALTLHTVGIPSELFTSLFAIGRTAGWTTHMLEQLSDNDLMRPIAVYVGPYDRQWQPLDERD
ncbi:MAG: citrate synthase/methylcitrate synthase [Dehalococcoidia bacterium]|nr:citrate synthase/methylcitrate synthase [Dehalococcoidia bacterium]